MIRDMTLRNRDIFNAHAANDSRQVRISNPASTSPQNSTHTFTMIHFPLPRLACWAIVIFSPLAHAADISLRDHRPAADGKTLDTPAFQAAIDAASSAGGGIVTVPAGKYAVARIVLKSNVTLRLEKDALLLGSTKKEDYTGGPSVILFADGAQHIALEGPGVIDGQTTADYGARWGAPDKPAFRTSVVRLENCSDVTIQYVTLRNSDSWTLHLRRCEKMRIDRITILDNYKRLNTDGIDPNSCKDVKITRCKIVCGDDAIVLKSTQPFPCEDIEISDCLLESATAGVKLGTESHGDFRNITVRDCKIVNTPVGVGFYIKDGATVQNVRVENIDMQLCPPTYHAVVPLFIDIEKRHADSKIGAVRDVSFENINITGGSGILMQGMPESPLQNIALKNISFTVKDPQDYARRNKPVGGTRTTKDARDTLYARQQTYAAFAHINALTIDGLKVEISPEAFDKFPRSAATLNHVTNPTLKDITRIPAVQSPSTVETK